MQNLFRFFRFSEPEMEEVSGNKFTNKYFALQPLDTSFGYFCDQYTFQVGLILIISVYCSVS